VSVGGGWDGGGSLTVEVGRDGGRVKEKNNPP